MWKSIKKLNPISRSGRGPRIVFSSPPPVQWVEGKRMATPPPPKISPPSDDELVPEFSVSQTSLQFYAGTPLCHTIHLEVRSLDNVEIVHNLPKCFAVDRLFGNGSARIKVAYLPVAGQQIVSLEPLFIKFTNKVLPVNSTNPITVHVNVQELESAMSAEQARHSVVGPMGTFLGQMADARKKRMSTARHDPLECLVCYMVFTDENGPRAPLVLRCGHTVCEQCATGLFNPASDTILCPMDRTPTTNKVSELSKNFAILDVLQGRNDEQDYQSIEVWNPTFRRKTPLCDDPDVPCYENPLHESTNYCTDCEVTYCENCYIRTHSSKILSNHQFVKVEDRPMEVPKCFYHADKPAEFACMKDNCRNEPRICCKECIQTIHHNHTPYMKAKYLADHNSTTLTAILNKLKVSEVETLMMIQKANEQSARFERTDEKYGDMVDALITVFEQKKENALKNLDAFIASKKYEFESEKEEVMEALKKLSDTRREIEKELRKKNVLSNAAEQLISKGMDMCNGEVRFRAAFLPFVYPDLAVLTAPPPPPVRDFTLQDTVDELLRLEEFIDITRETLR